MDNNAFVLYIYNLLRSGNVMDQAYVRHLTAFMSSPSDAVVNATVAYLCEGVRQVDAAELYGVKQSAIARMSQRIRALDKGVVDAWQCRQPGNPGWSAPYMRALAALSHAPKPINLEATIKHVSKGVSQDDASREYGVSQPSLARLYRTLRKRDALVIKAIALR